MNFGQIYFTDIANGAGCRTSLFVSGCTHHCKECFSPQTWDFDFGEPYTSETEEVIMESLRPAYIAGLSVLGGEPMEKENQEALLPLFRRVKKEISHANIWVYSGYTWEELTDPGNARCHTKFTDEILSLIDVLVDGEFHIKEKDISLRFRGSKNQRIIDVRSSLQNARVILSNYND